MNNEIISRVNGNVNGNTVNMDTLLAGLKKEDGKNLRLMRNYKWFLWIMVVVYSLLLVINPDPDVELHSRFTGLCYVTAFSLFALVFNKLYKEFRAVDYSVTSFEMLSAAAKRYRFQPERLLYLLPSLLLIDAGFTISIFNRWQSFAPLNRILVVQAIYFSVIIIALFAGYLIWRFKKKPHRDNALRMLKELQEL
jgi:hypothetical protein